MYAGKGRISRSGLIDCECERLYGKEFCLKGESETEVTVTSKRHAQAERAKRWKREEKAASIVKRAVSY